MKKVLHRSSILRLFLSIAVFLTFLTPGQAKEKNRTVVPVSKELLYRHVEKLASISPARSYDNVASLNKAASYIYEEFKKYGCRVQYQKYRAKGKTYKNVIASLGPKRGACIVVGAHYDACGHQPAADDNASGVSAILEIARLIHTLKPKLKYRLDLVAFTLEEPPYFRSPYMGSAVHAHSLAKRRVKVKLMISVDMIGYFSDVPPNPGQLSPLLIAPAKNRANATAVIGKTGQGELVRRISEEMTAGSNIEAVPVTAPLTAQGIDYSDHRNYWKHNYPAVLISNFPVTHSPTYHRPGDTIDTLDFDRISEVVKGLYRAVVLFCRAKD